MKIAGRNKRSIILGSSAVVFILLWVFAIMPFYDRIMKREQDIASNLKLIRKYSAAIETGAQQENGRDDIYGRLAEIEKRLVTGQTIQLAAADIQKIADSVARQSEVSIKTVKVMDAEDVDSFVAVPIQVRFESDLTRMSKFINLIETNRKLMTIPELKIRVKNRRKPREISVTLKIAGYMKKEETES